MGGIVKDPINELLKDYLKTKGVSFFFSSAVFFTALGLRESASITTTVLYSIPGGLFLLLSLPIFCLGLYSPWPPLRYKIWLILRSRIVAPGLNIIGVVVFVADWLHSISEISGEPIRFQIIFYGGFTLFLLLLIDASIGVWVTDSTKSKFGEFLTKSRKIVTLTLSRMKYELLRIDPFIMVTVLIAVTSVYLLRYRDGHFKTDINLTEVLLNAAFGAWLVFFFDWWWRPKIIQAGFKEFPFGASNQYIHRKLCFKLSGKSSLGQCFMDIEWNGKHTFAKWDETAEPLVGSIFHPELVPATFCLPLHYGNLYSIPIIIEQNGSYQIFDGWWYGNIPTLQQSKTVSVHDKITLTLSGPGVRWSKQFRINEIL